jgi:hypothetical protein
MLAICTTINFPPWRIAASLDLSATNHPSFLTAFGCGYAAGHCSSEETEIVAALQFGIRNSHSKNSAVSSGFAHVRRAHYFVLRLSPNSLLGVFPESRIQRMGIAALAARENLSIQDELAARIGVRVDRQNIHQAALSARSSRSELLLCAKIY